MGKKKYYETVTIASRSPHIGRKFQAQENVASPPGLNTVPSKDTSITSGITREATKDDDDSLLCGAPLALDQAGDNISLLGDDTSIKGGNVYPTGDASTATGYTPEGYNVRKREKGPPEQRSLYIT